MVALAGNQSVTEKTNTNLKLLMENGGNVWKPKPHLGKGGRKIRYMRYKSMWQKAISTVLNNANHEIEIQLKAFKPWIETSIWTERMLTTLVNGVNGGKWHSLCDKVYRKRTLEIAWQQVAANKGAAGINYYR